MNGFLTEDFLLHNAVAKELYHDVAKHQPIFDYHCHLSPSQIAGDHQFTDLAEIWLAGDHYKWRGLRTLGVEERLITGDATAREKFQAYAEAVPQFIGNPLYHWTHLELKRPFGIDDLVLNGQTAEEVWQRCNDLLSQPEFSARGILQQMNVKMVGTTDDPTDDLQAHASIAKDSDFAIKVCPSFRPDKALNIERDGFKAYVQKLAHVSDIDISNFASLTQALAKRLQYFEQHGCLASDHGIEHLRFAPIPDEKTLDAILDKGLNEQALSDEEIAQYQTALLVFLGQEYHRRGIVMQMHIGPIRNNNQRMFDRLGPDSGYDSIGDRLIALPLARLLNEMDKDEQLPKTILYTINPRDNEVLATMVGNFQGEGIRGKVQFGSGWWFNDQKDGMLQQLQVHAQMGLLSVFVGMLTDSRSFLSFTRHEYFRRILCQMIGQWVVDGEVPHDMTLLSQMVENICYGNAKQYFTKG